MYTSTNQWLRVGREENSLKFEFAIPIAVQNLGERGIALRLTKGGAEGNKE